MTVTPGDDAPRRPDRAGFSDALTYAFADSEADVCGVLRLGLSEGRASGLALVFRGGEPAAARADTIEIPDGGAYWADVRLPGLSTETLEPLAAWRVRFASEELDLDLRFDALGPAIELPADAPAAVAGGMEGFDHVCRVEGTVGGAAFAGRGQRGRSWGAPDWSRMAIARTLSLWLDDERAVTAVAIRPAKGRHHADEQLAAFVFDPAADAEPVVAVDEPRISTAYDSEGRQRRAGLELYVGEEDAYPRRAAGEAVAGTSLDLRAHTEGAAGLRLDCAFFRWRMEGRAGVGRYDVLRVAG